MSIRGSSPDEKAPEANRKLQGGSLEHEAGSISFSLTRSDMVGAEGPVHRSERPAKLMPSPFLILDP